MRATLPLLTLCLLAACADEVKDDAADGGVPGDAAIKMDGPPVIVPDGRISDATGGTPDTGVTQTGTYTHYVTNSLKVGATAVEANSFAFDLDGDGEVDDALGRTLALVGAFLDVDGRINVALKAGQIILLHSLRADSLTSDTTTSWRVLVGDQAPTPKYDGTDTFTVSPSSPAEAVLGGKITSGAYLGGPSIVSVEVAFLEGVPPIRFRLINAQLAAKVTENGCTGGRIGGAITQKDIDGNVLPALAAGLDSVIAGDAGCRQNLNDCDDNSKMLLGLFDTDPKDRMITLNELQGNFIINLLFTNDLDLLGDDGNPGKDGQLDSTSLALAFTCVKAGFTVAGE